MVNFYIKSIIIAGSEITVDYEIILSNEEFQGAIGGGRTVLPLASVEASIDSLKIDIESYIEKTVGITPMSLENKTPNEDEDPL